MGEDLGDALEDCCEVGEEGERRPPLEPDGEPERFACPTQRHQWTDVQRLFRAEENNAAQTAGSHQIIKARNVAAS